MHNVDLDLCLLYWGRSGGGKRLFLETVTELSLYNNLQLHVSASEEVISELGIENARVSIVDGVFGKKRQHILLEVFGILQKKRALLNYCSNFKVSNVMIVMSSPLDVLLKNKKSSNVVFWRVLHDAQPHPGDFWPNKYFIRYYLRTSKIVTLSKYVSKMIANIQVFQTELNRNIEPKSKAFSLPDDYILIAGRAKEYKNTQEVFKALSLFPKQIFVVTNLGKRVTFDASPNVVIIEKSLDDAEFEYAISNSRGVVAAYSEASQSGIVEQAVYWGVPVLISNRGGLIEQVKDNNEGVVIDGIDALSIAEGLEKLLLMEKHSGNKTIKLNLAQSIIRRAEFSRCKIDTNLP
jgi:glycosyltransferase involved in cell wall biosynthesis